MENPQNTGRPATGTQVKYLRDKGVNTDKLSKTHASQLIDTLVKRDLDGCCSYKQIKQLRRNDFPQDLTKREASPVMAALARNRWKPLPPATRKNLMARIMKNRQPVAAPQEEEMAW